MITDVENTLMENRVRYFQCSLGQMLKKGYGSLFSFSCLQNRNKSETIPFFINASCDRVECLSRSPRKILLAVVWLLRLQSESWKVGRSGWSCASFTTKVTSPLKFRPRRQPGMVAALKTSSASSQCMLSVCL